MPQVTLESCPKSPLVISVIMLLVGIIIMSLSAVGISRSNKEGASESATMHKTNLGMSFVVIIGGALGLFLFSEKQLCKS
jgi:hypothetical protein